VQVLEPEPGRALQRGAGQREPPCGVEVGPLGPQRADRQAAGPGRRHRAAREQQRQLAIGGVPGRDGRVGEQHARVGGEQRPGDAGRESRGGAQQAQPAGYVTRRGRRDQAGMRGEYPGAHAHRRGRLGHPQHVEEALGPAELGGEEAGSPVGGRRGDQPAGAREGRPAGGGRGRGQHRGGPGQLAEEQVGGQVRLPPPGDLEDRPTVVGPELGLGYLAYLAHGRRPAKAAATPATSSAAAPPAHRHSCGRSLVVTTGSGGRP